MKKAKKSTWTVEKSNHLGTTLKTNTACMKELSLDQMIEYLRSFGP
jgi:hypothetical protein